MDVKTSRRQQQMLEFIQGFMDDHQFPPTVRDIQNGCEISSTSVVDYNLHKLQTHGFLKRRPDVSRGIELVGEGLRGLKRDLVSIPVMGNIAAGEPLHVPGAPSTAEESDDFVDLPSSMTDGKRDVFALRVKGLSMVDALVADGDLVLLEPADRVNNGDMVAAWLNQSEETTLKRFYMEGDIVRLQPENESMEPIMVAANNVSVRGRVVGVIRTM
ncbi:transcriptional repressor LexA [Dehalococcoidia bacterium]|nr:transcriptional repressor LexA [Dehalococcoidia bacterium]